MKIQLSWSGGKDSMMTLHKLVSESQAPSSLLTTFSGEFRRITMHGVREALLDMQAEALTVPVDKLFLPAEADMKTYNQAMHQAYEDAAGKGIDTIAFGDIFLEDLRNYRERQTEKAGLRSIFPLWGEDTRLLMENFIHLGYKTVVVALDSSKLSPDMIGRVIDHEFLEQLPENVDPCGENGEFHTFVIDGPLFEKPLSPAWGEVVKRDYPSPVNKNETISYYFQELLPA